MDILMRCVVGAAFLALVGIALAMGERMKGGK